MSYVFHSLKIIFYVDFVIFKFRFDIFSVTVSPLLVHVSLEYELCRVLVGASAAHDGEDLVEALGGGAQEHVAEAGGVRGDGEQG